MIVSRSRKTLFDGYSVASTGYVYNSSGESDSDSGWFTSKADYCFITYSCATLTSSGLTYRVEGRLNGSDRIASIATGTISSAMSIDNIININEKVDELRFGVKADSTATPNIFYASVSLVETK